MKIDSEFKAMLPPLVGDELRLLRESIEREGIREPLIVWAEEGILLDGHNRIEIAAELHISYQTRELSFADREAAKDWIDRNQLGRRNLAPTVASLVRGRIYNRAKGTRGGSIPLKRGNGKYGVAASLAKEFGVGHATVEKDGAFASAVETLRGVVPDLERKIMSGAAPYRSAVIEASKASGANPDAARALLNRAEFKPKKLPRRPESERIERWIDTIEVAVAGLCSCDVTITPQDQVKRLRVARIGMSAAISKMERGHDKHSD